MGLANGRTRLAVSSISDAAQLRQVIQSHIVNEVTHYKGQCYAWDVVNEIFEDDGSFRNSVFYRVLGDSYIPLAFAAAALADPDAKLYYNDYNIETAGTPKSAAALKLVQDIQASGVRIDGVGLQAHFIVGSTPSRNDLKAGLAAFLALGVEVAYTELDVRHPKLPASQGDLQRQSADYQNVILACIETKGCVGLTVWDFADQVGCVVLRPPSPTDTS